MDKTENTLREALDTLEAHPGYAADVTFAAIWKWLEQKDAAIASLRAALKDHSHAG